MFRYTSNACTSSQTSSFHQHLSNHVLTFQMADDLRTSSSQPELELVYVRRPHMSVPMQPDVDPSDCQMVVYISTRRQRWTFYMSEGCGSDPKAVLPIPGRVPAFWGRDAPVSARWLRPPRPKPRSHPRLPPRRLQFPPLLLHRALMSCHCQRPSGRSSTRRPTSACGPLFHLQRNIMAAGLS